MTQQEIEDAVMRYLAQDDSDEPSFQSLTTILELMPEGRQLTDAQYDDDEIEDKEQLRGALDQLAADGLVERRFGERDYEGSYRITQDGFYQAVLGPEALVVGAEENTGEPINAASWTGSRLVYVDDQVLIKIRKIAATLQVQARKMNYQSEEDAKDLIGLCDALAGLCEMAQPEVALIDRITAHPKFKYYAALFGFVATIRGALGI